MKKVVVLAMLLFATLTQAQVFSGKGDQKIQVGAVFQEYARGIQAVFDYGLGENISVGVASGYVLGVEGDVKVKFKDAFDLKARFNANIGNVLNISDNFDLYPGLHLGLKNFGGHIGARYFFTSGFGVYSELMVPLATYESDPVGFDKLNNQLMIALGASFNL
ncbi:DUF6646 family protein [Pseudofulvibacter geojedonensis]|uniref:DUF6646 family protein n=1 Tax=Pseudofulvibacter geojedonensis TaxID=1123758 RepID=A0ABW3I3J1_9FLAO